MTDLEISKTLAKAIGWETILNNRYCRDCWVWTGGNWKLFDYRDWAVAGPIAERYNCFPWQSNNGEWYPVAKDGDGYTPGAETPQRAIAMAVIQGAKK